MATKPTHPHTKGNSTAPSQSGGLSAFKNRQFRFIWFGGTLSHLGSFIHLTAAAWLMTTLTSSSTLIALVQSAWALPTMLLALLAGATADIYDKRSQMIVSMAVCSLSIFVLFGVYQTGALEPWSLLILMVMLGVGAAFFFPAWVSSLPQMVAKEQFVSAVALNNLSFNIARCIGPAIAGEVLVRLGAGAAFVINGVSCLYLILALRLWKREKPISSGPKETISGAIGDGLRYASCSPKVLRVVGGGFMLPICASAILALTPLIALQFDDQPRTLGLLLLGFGGGAMAGALSVTWMQSKATMNKLASGSALIIAAVLWVLSVAGNPLLAVVALAVGGFAWVQSMSILQILIQTSCPRWVVGRMVSLLAMVFSAGIAIGAAIWGAVADFADISVALSSAGTATVFAGVFLLTLPSMQPNDGRLESSADSQPDFPINAGTQVSPVKTTIEYSVDEERRQTFEKLMQEIRRIRTRDGARRWRLYPSPHSEMVWIEEFETPTWAHHLRLTTRGVKGDVETYSALNQLCATQPTFHNQVGDSEDTFHAPVPGIQNEDGEGGVTSPI